MNRSLFTRIAAVLLIVAMPTFVFAIGKPSAAGGSMSWDIDVTGHDSIVLTVQHDGEIYTKTFKAGKPVVFNLKDMPSDVPVDGLRVAGLRPVELHRCADDHGLLQRKLLQRLHGFLRTLGLQHGDEHLGVGQVPGDFDVGNAGRAQAVFAHAGVHQRAQLATELGRDAV